MKITEFRKQYPQYDDLDDATLSKSLHSKYYSDMEFDAFNSKFTGVESKPVDNDGLIGNSVDNLQKRGLEIAGNAQKAVGTLTETFIDKPANSLANITGINPGIWYDKEEGLQASWNMPAEKQASIGGELKDLSDSAIETDTGYKPDYTVEKFEDDITVKNFFGMLAEQGVPVVADMVASVFGLPVYAASELQRLGDERAKNNGKEEADWEDIYMASPGAVANVVGDRLLADTILGKVGKAIKASNGDNIVDKAVKVGGAMAVAGAQGAANEGVQEGIEYTATHQNTEKGFDNADFWQSVRGGAYIGGGLGAGGRGFTATREVMQTQQDNYNTTIDQQLNDAEQESNVSVDTQVEQEGQADLLANGGSDTSAKVNKGLTGFSPQESIQQRIKAAQNQAETDRLNALDEKIALAAESKKRQELATRLSMGDPTVQEVGISRKPYNAYQVAQSEIGVNNANADKYGLPLLPEPQKLIGTDRISYDDMQGQAGEKYANAQQELYSLDDSQANPSIPKQAAALPKIPTNYTDNRLQNPMYRDVLQNMSGELVEGGGIALIPSQENGVTFKGRTSSLNPDWFKDGAFTYTNKNGNQSSVSVKGFKKAIDNAIEGKPLKDSEKRIVTEVLNYADNDVQSEIEYNNQVGDIDLEQQALEAQKAKDRESIEEYFTSMPERPSGEPFMPTEQEIVKAVDKQQQGKLMSKSEQSIVANLDEQAWQSRNPKGNGKSNGLRDALNTNLQEISKNAKNVQKRDALNMQMQEVEVNNANEVQDATQKPVIEATQEAEQDLLEMFLNADNKTPQKDNKPKSNNDSLDIANFREQANAAADRLKLQGDKEAGKVYKENNNRVEVGNEGQTKSIGAINEKRKASDARGWYQESKIYRQMANDIRDGETKDDVIARYGKNDPIRIEGIKLNLGNISLSTSGKPFKSEKSARMSKTFKSLTNGEVVPVDGGFGVRESSVSTLKDKAVSQSNIADNDAQTATTKVNSDNENSKVTETDTSKQYQKKPNMENDLIEGKISVGEYLDSRNIKDDDLDVFELSKLRDQSELYADSENQYKSGIKEIKSSIADELSKAESKSAGTPKQRSDRNKNIAKWNKAKQTLDYIQRDFLNPFSNNIIDKLPPILKVKHSNKFNNIQYGEQAKTDFRKEVYTFYAQEVIKRANQLSKPSQETSYNQEATTSPVNSEIEQDTATKNNAETVNESSNSQANSVVAENATTQVIEDVGEKLGGAKKDKVMTPKSQENMSDAEFIMANPLSKIWPKSEVDNIEDKSTAAFATLTRDAIPSKPRSGYKLKRWVAKVMDAREAMETFSENQEQFLAMAKNYGAGDMQNLLAKHELLVSIDRDQWKRVGKVIDYSKSYRYIDDKKTAMPSMVYEVDGVMARKEGAMNVSDILDNVKKLLNADVKTKRMAFEIRGYQSSKTWFINKKGDRDYTQLKTFTSVEDARVFLKENYDELVSLWEANKEKKNVKKSDMRGDNNTPRIGEDYRNGKDVGADDFMNTFGFRGVEFGNWVKQGKGGKERQGLLNDAYDAFMDLAAITNIPPKAISLNGTLGLGLGSRGSGKAMAHFEPDNVVINLTKTKGAGSLAHEWFHAMDNYFSRYRTGKIQESRNSKVSYREAEHSYVTFAPEPMMIHKDYPQSRMTKTELARRMAEAKGSKYFAEDKWQLDPNHPAGVRPEVETAFADLVNVLDSSDMKGRALTIDNGKPGYWSMVIERAARSFENYVITKLKDSGNKNDFLANVTPIENFPREKSRYPYLLDEEVQPIAEAFDNLFNVIETKETENGNVALFSRKDNDVDTTNQVEIDQNEPADITDLRTDLARYYKIEASEVEARADELLLPDDVQNTLEELYGKRIVGFKGGRNADAFNGLILPERNDRVYVATDSTKPVMNIAGHELLHSIREENPNLYADLVSATRGLIQNEWDYLDKLNAARKAEGKDEAGLDLAIEEILADTMGDNFTNPTFWAKVSQALDNKKPGLFNQLIKKVKSFLKTLKNALNPLGHDKYISDVEAAQTAVAEFSALHMKSRMGNKKAKTQVESLASRDPKFMTTNINDNLTDEQKLDRLSKKEAVGYARKFLAHEIPYLQNAIDNLNADKKQFDYKKRVAVEQEWLDRYKAAREFIVNKFPEEFENAVAPEDAGKLVAETFTQKIDAMVNEYLSDNAEDIGYRMEEGDSVKDIQEDVIEAIEYGLSYSDSSDYSTNIIQQKIVSEKVSAALNKFFDSGSDVLFSRIEQDNGKGTPAYEAAKAKGLDMSKEARMQRARDMGFDTDTVYYHGTNKDFDAFDPNRAIGTQFWSTTDKQAVEDGEVGAQGKGVIKELYAKVQNPAGWREYDQLGIDEIIGRGYDGVKLVEGDEVTLIAFNPNQYRSINAAFDPDQADSPNLMFSRKGLDKEPVKEPELLAKWGRKEKAKKNLYDRFERVKQLQDAVNKITKGKAPDLYDATQKFLAILPSKLTDMHNAVKRNINTMSKKGISPDVMGVYMYALHAPERNASMQERFDVENGSGMSNEQASKLQAELEAEYPSINAESKKWRKMIDDSLDERVKSGTVSAEARNQWRKDWPNYVPLKNKIDDRTELNEGDGELSVMPMDGFMGTGKRFNLTGAEIKKAKGRVSMAGDILSNAVFDMQRGLVRGEKNRVNFKLKETILNYPQNSIWRMTDTKPENADAIEIFENGQKQYAVIADKELYSSLTGINEDEFAMIDTAITYIKKTITAWNPSFMVINTFRDSLMAYINGNQELGAKGANQMARYAYDAMKSSWRYERDSSGDNNVAKEWDKWHKLYRLSGGKTGYMDFNNLDQTQKRIDREFLKDQKLTLKNAAPKAGRALYENVLKHVEDAGSATENMWRLAAFRVAIEQGKSRSEAATIAKNLTVNFDRKGLYARKLDRYFLFYNPAMQGLRRIGQSLNSKKRIAAVAGSLMAMGFMAGLQGDEDEYGNNLFDQLPEHEKMRSIPIVFSDGTRINIPMAYGLGFFTHMGMKMAQMYRYQQTNGRNGISVEDGMYEAVNSLAMHFNPIGGMQFTEGVMGEQDQFLQLLAPVILDPFIQVINNKNGFGGSLYPENAYNPDDIPDSEKVFSHDKGNVYDLVAKGLSSASGGDGVSEGKLEFTPATFEAVYRTFTGGAGRFVEQVATLGLKGVGVSDEEVTARDIPVASSVFKSNADKIYYDAYNEIRKDVKKFKSDFDDYRLGKSRTDSDEKVKTMKADARLKMVRLVKGTEKKISSLRKKIKTNRALMNQVKNDDKKKMYKERIEKLEDQQTKLQAQLVQKAGEIRAAN